MIYLIFSSKSREWKTWIRFLLVLQKILCMFQGGLNDSSQCNSTISPCGSYIFSISEDGTVNVWESNTGKQMAFYSSETSTIGCGGSVDYHPFDHISAFSFYSSNYNSSTVLLLKYTRLVLILYAHMIHDNLSSLKVSEKIYSTYPSSSAVLQNLLYAILLS